MRIVCSMTPSTAFRELLAIFVSFSIVTDSAANLFGIYATDFMTRGRFKSVSLDSGSREHVSARSAVECCSLCAIRPFCKSVHFCHHTERCSLNDRTVCDTGYSGLVPSPGCIYYDTLDHPKDEVFQGLCTPSPCVNGGTCSPVCGQTQTTCSCPSLFYGDFCENRDGHWGNWNGYSACDNSCKRTRTRTCNSPSPEGTGLPCSGSDTDTWQCESDDCDDD